MHRLILEHIIALLMEDFLPLQKKSFANRSTRTNLFIDKLKKGSPIDLTNGETAVIDTVKVNDQEYSKDNFDDLKQVLPTLTAKDKIQFLSGNKSYKISALAKTTELGGKGKGGTLGPERKAIANLEQQFTEIGKPITLVIGDQSYDNIDGITNVKENQKADFAFTSNGNPKVFISFKPGAGPSDVISYGGIVKLKDNPEVASFIEAVQAKTTNMKDTRKEYSAPVSDLEVAQKVMFGGDSGDYGLNNVQAIIQGSNLRLQESNGNYVLEASKIITPDNIPLDGAYAPYYNARYADDRSQFGIQNCRFAIIPQGARKNTITLDLSSES